MRDLHLLFNCVLRFVLINVLRNRFEEFLQFLSRLKALNFRAFNRANKRSLSAALFMQTRQHNTINNVDYI